MKRILLPLLLALPCALQAAPLKTDPANSRVTAVFRQMTVPVEAQFHRFTAAVYY